VFNSPPLIAWHKCAIWKGDNAFNYHLLLDRVAKGSNNLGLPIINDREE